MTSLKHGSSHDIDDRDLHGALAYIVLDLTNGVGGCGLLVVCLYVDLLGGAISQMKTPRGIAWEIGGSNSTYARTPFSHLGRARTQPH